MDESSQKIIDAAMSLVRDKGYTATTTKDIAQKAGVNECTLFRKFQTKKEIVLRGVEQEKWRGNLTPKLFENVKWNLESDLQMFMTKYMEKMTPEFVKLSIGLRAPQIYEETAPLIMKVPQAFLSSLIQYFQEMHQRGRLPQMDFESLALTIFSSTFGYTFLSASFDNKLFETDREQYIKNSVAVFVQGIKEQK